MFRELNHEILLQDRTKDGKNKGLTEEDVDKLIKTDTNRFNQFLYNIDTLSKEVYIDNEAQDKFKGNIFETFGQYLLLLNPMKPFLISNCQPSTPDEIGVDLVGGHIENGLPHYVQFKYRQYDYIITYRDLDTAFTKVISEAFRNRQKMINLTVITSAKMLHWDCVRFARLEGINLKCFCRKRLQCHDEDQLSEMTDNIQGFWDGYKYSLMVAITKRMEKHHE